LFASACDTVAEIAADDEDSVDVSTCDVARSTEVVTDSLALFYPMNGSVQDESGNCRHAVFNGLPTFVDGIKGRALSLNGSTNYLMVEPEASVLPASRYTLVFLVKVDEPFSVNPVTIAEIANWTGGCLRVGWVGTSGASGPGIQDCGGPDSVGPNGAARFAHWHMFTIRSSSWTQNKNFRTNRSRVDTLYWGNWESDAGEIIGGQPIFFGTNTEGNTADFDRLGGLFDEIRIYNRHLSSQEEETLFRHYFGLE